MKKCKKFVVAFLTLMLLVVLGTTAVFAVNVNPGKTTTVTFEFKNVYGAQGKVSFSGDDIIESYSFSKVGSGSTSEETNMFAIYGDEKGTYALKVTVKLKSTAKAGQKATISVDYADIPKDDFLPVDRTAKTATITVVKPNVPVVTPSVDYTELNRQIEIAEGLEQTGYTDDSWNAMIQALDAAKALRSSKSQTAVDEGAAALEAAIKALVKVDYSKLQAAIDSANEFINSDDFAKLWQEFLEALINGEALLNVSGDQAEVDAAADAILKALEALKKAMEEFKTPIINDVEVEVPVVVEPTEPFCNIPMHQVWPILFIISAVLNAGFIVLIVVYIVRKKKNGKDNTPLVDYQIGDDEN